VSCPALYRRAVHREPSSIASPPLRHRRAIQLFIAEPSSALLQSCPSPSRPLPSRPLRDVQRFIAKSSIGAVVQCELSIKRSPSRPVLYH
jgi:hypothetical protein